jgi:hypothetical protein
MKTAEEPPSHKKEAKKSKELTRRTTCRMRPASSVRAGAALPPSPDAAASPRSRHATLSSPALHVSNAVPQRKMAEEVSAALA